MVALWFSTLCVLDLPFSTPPEPGWSTSAAGAGPRGGRRVRTYKARRPTRHEHAEKAREAAIATFYHYAAMPARKRPGMYLPREPEGLAQNA